MPVPHKKHACTAVWVTQGTMPNATGDNLQKILNSVAQNSCAVFSPHLDQGINKKKKNSPNSKSHKTARWAVPSFPGTYLWLFAAEGMKINKCSRLTHCTMLGPDKIDYTGRALNSCDETGRWHKAYAMCTRFPHNKKSGRSTPLWTISWSKFSSWQTRVVSNW